MGWLLGWKYRKRHLINGSSAGDVTDYQIKIIVHYGSGTDSGDDVYLGGKCNTDFSDIRFTDSDGETLLNYWIEEYTDSDKATVWVKVPSIPSGGSATIYIYYGNSSASDASDGTSTFDFFDDFESYADGSAIDGQGGWVTKRIGGSGEATVRLYNGRNHLHISSTDQHTAVVHPFNSNQQNAIRIYVVADDWDEAFEVAYSDGNIDSYGRPYNGYLWIWWGWSGTESRIRKAVNGSYTDIDTISDSGQNNVYYKIENRWYGTGLKGWRDGSVLMSGSDSEFTSETYIHLGEYAGSSRYIDWVAVRKYVEPEPTNGYWAREESYVLDIRSETKYTADTKDIDLFSDVQHSDSSHSDVASSTVAFSDIAFSNGSFSDVAHSDTATSEVGHSDVLHSDVHSDSAHSDSGSNFHSDAAHSDVAHSDGTYNDLDWGANHLDTPHSDTAYSDVHSDVAHSDVAHSDSHSDVYFSDVSHSDIVHSDVAHSDVAHSDVVHSDTPHSDVAHSDTSHSDTSHSDMIYNNIKLHFSGE